MITQNEKKDNGLSSHFFDEFYITVKEMRKVQKEYFKLKIPGLLNKAKAFERDVDKLIDKYDEFISGQRYLF